VIDSNALHASTTTYAPIALPRKTRSMIKNMPSFRFLHRFECLGVIAQEEDNAKEKAKKSAKKNAKKKKENANESAREKRKKNRSLSK